MLLSACTGTLRSSLRDVRIITLALPFTEDNAGHSPRKAGRSVNLAISRSGLETHLYPPYVCSSVGSGEHRLLPRGTGRVTSRASAPRTAGVRPLLAISNNGVLHDAIRVWNRNRKLKPRGWDSYGTSPGTPKIHHSSERTTVMLTWSKIGGEP